MMAKESVVVLIVEIGMEIGKVAVIIMMNIVKK